MLMTTPDSILTRYRTNWNGAESGVDSRAVWARIEAGMGTTATRSSAAIIPMPQWIRYAAAAVVFVGGLLLLARFLSTTSTPIYRSQDTLASLTLPDGSGVVLRPHSTLTSLESATGTDRYRLEGEAWFQVVGADRVFEVVTTAGTVRVHGTRFNVRTWSGSTTVYLESGSIGFSNRVASILLEPGHAATAESDSGPITVEPASTDNYLAWTRNELVLDATPVGEILRELEHHYNVRLTAPDSVLTIPVSGRFVMGDLDRTLQALHLSTGHPIRIVSK